MRSIIFLLSAIIATVATADELWCLSRLTDTVKRFDAKTGELLGYLVSTNAEHNATIDPGDAWELIDIKRDINNGAIYLLSHEYNTSAGQKNNRVARYDRHGNPLDVPLVDDPQGEWWRKYSYPTDALALGGENIYIGARTWSTTAGITFDLRGKRLVFEHKKSDGSAAGRLIGAQPGSDDYKTGAMWIHATDVETTLPGEIFGMVFDDSGNLIVGCHLGKNRGLIYRFDSAGEWYGSGGTGDTNSIVPDAMLEIRDILLDSSGRLYVCGKNGANVASGVERYTSAGLPDPAPGKSGALFHGWDGYDEYSTAVNPTAMALNSSETILYLYSPGSVSVYGVVPAGLRMYAVGGDNDGEFLDVLVPGTDAEASTILYVETAPPGSIFILR